MRFATYTVLILLILLAIASYQPYNDPTSQPNDTPECTVFHPIQPNVTDALAQYLVEDGWRGSPGDPDALYSPPCFGEEVTP